MFLCIQVVLGLLAVGFGAMVLRGVLGVRLSSNRLVWFLRLSLLAALAGLFPLTRHLTPVQGICMMSVYCSGAVVLAWRKFHLVGLWRAAFAFLVVAILYLNVVSVSIRLSAITSVQSGLCSEFVQFLLASFFAALGVLAITMSRTRQTH
jgi:energy-converting hydrogenase Eha subunit C